MDKRLTASNGRVAALALEGRVTADRYTEGEALQVNAPLADLRQEPDGPRLRQLLRGVTLRMFEEGDGWAFVQSDRDGYVGYMLRSALGPVTTATHHVATPATHLYRDEDFRSPDLMALSFGSRITVTAERPKFFETADGYIPKKHLWPLTKPFTDPVTVAQLHFGVPYLWGGNSIRGIDCSGLVQAALLACDIPCPADSDLQSAQAGKRLPKDATQKRGDLYFWKGHVAMLVDEETLIHANAHHMAVAYEPLEYAMLRIAAQDGGPMITRKRL